MLGSDFGFALEPPIPDCGTRRSLDCYSLHYRVAYFSSSGRRVMRPSKKRATDACSHNGRTKFHTTKGGEYWARRLQAEEGNTETAGCGKFVLETAPDKGERR